MKWRLAGFILVTALMACPDAFAVNTSRSRTVQTYTNQAVPVSSTSDASYGTPLRPGQMTLEEVLETHPQPKKPALQAPALSAGATTTPPVLAAPAQSSTEGNMLMQGMQTVLQQSGAPLKAPQLPAASSFASGSTASPLSLASPASPASTSVIAVAPPAPLTPPPPMPAPAVPGVQYQPGQEPKILYTAPAETATAAPVGEMAPPDTQSDTQDIEKSSVAAGADTSGMVATPGCEPRNEKWTKTCVEAGYPANFTGEIVGETHTVCPSNSLQDVWVANSCAPPGDQDKGMPLSAPAPINNPSASVPGVTAPAATDLAEEHNSSAPAGMPVSENISTLSGTAETTSTVALSPADGSCGPMNGLAASTKPVNDLCASGMPTDVVGDGPWRWSCMGAAGSMTVSCAAPVAPAPTLVSSATPSKAVEESTSATSSEDGQCGAANGMGVDQAPTSDLCLHGIVSRVSGDGPWTWACSGRNGGIAAACIASRKTDGICGGAAVAGTDEMPLADLCAAGIASAITGNGPWNWTCSGLYGGAPALCSAAGKKDAVCGTASLAGHREAPQDNLCSVGQASSVSGGGPWNWTCVGANGGSQVACTAPIKVSGGCGTANGVAVTAAPTDNLCAFGKATRVTGDGPWSWNCSGTDGGDSESCTAPLSHAEAAAQTQASPAAQDAGLASPSTSSASSASPSSSALASAAVNDEAFVHCGSAAELAAFEAPSKDLCSKGTATAVTGNGPWSWMCTDSANHKTDCNTLAPAGSFAPSSPQAAPAKGSEMPAPKASPPAAVVKAEEQVACGVASGQGTASKPSDGLCSVGKPSAVQGHGPWTWTCAKGKAKASCEAAKLVDATCGGANGAVLKSAPGGDLCVKGSPTQIQGNGPWMWSCVGSGGGVSVSCSAASATQTRVDGACGAAASAPTLTPPAANLCDSGIPGTVNGIGPWTWTCSGLNGGIASLCSAQKNAPPAPPPPGPVVNGLCGNANGAVAASEPEEGLCASGTVSAVSGNGPWNWSCLGGNGGMTVSCTALLQPPAPITGVCGNSTGVPTLTMPRSALCAAGISSAVSGKGPWTWSCSGTNGGGAVACVAPLAGGGLGDGTGLPSMVTPSSPYSSSSSGDVAPAPRAAASTPVAAQALVTPHLPAGPLPPLANGAVPPMQPSKPFSAPPEPSALPPEPAPSDAPQPPLLTPDLPAGTEDVQPPPIRDTLKPSAALKTDAQGHVIPGNHFTLPAELSTIAFTHGAENIDNAAVPTLDRLARTLQANGGVRITLTAYADVGENTSPRDARRLSLTRALAIRDYLTTKGVSSARIDVRALGANVPSGNPDRVDVKVN
ncbi:MAG: OmpA family protein [Pseudomonadota bacterium]|nr:OmpA family protein [Pseudomonadota bacterium]